MREMLQSKGAQPQSFSELFVCQPEAERPGNGAKWSNGYGAQVFGIYDDDKDEDEDEDEDGDVKIKIKMKMKTMAPSYSSWG